MKRTAPFSIAICVTLLIISDGLAQATAYEPSTEQAFVVGVPSNCVPERDPDALTGFDRFLPLPVTHNLTKAKHRPLVLLAKQRQRFPVVLLDRGKKTGP